MVKAKKSLGQHFLYNNYFLQKICKCSGLYQQNTSKTDCADTVETIVEIGPGTGLLTNFLLNTGCKVICIEKDASLYPLLEKKFAQCKNFQLVKADALHFNYENLACKQAILVSNLPYNISVPLILGYLQNTHLFLSYNILIQKEVAERLAAKVNTKHYGRLAVLAQSFCKVTKHFDIPGTAFTPSTKVTSTFISLNPIHDEKFAAYMAHTNSENTTHQQIIEYKHTLFKKLSVVAEACFSHRRKMLRGTIGKTNPALMKLLEEQGIQPTDRSENINIEQFNQCALNS